MRAPGSIAALMRVKAMGVVYDREPRRSEITLSDTSAPGRAGGNVSRLYAPRLYNGSGLARL